MGSINLPTNHFELFKFTSYQVHNKRKYNKSQSNLVIGRIATNGRVPTRKFPLSMWGMGPLSNTMLLVTTRMSLPNRLYMLSTNVIHLQQKDVNVLNVFCCFTVMENYNWISLPCNFSALLHSVCVSQNFLLLQLTISQYARAVARQVR